MFSTILVPLDGSALADAALRSALRLARGRARSVFCCHAVDTRDAVLPSAGLGYPCDPTPSIRALEDEGRAIFDRARAIADEAGLSIETQLVYDDPVSATIRAATDRHADLIVMGTHGRTGAARAFLGSTTDGVLRGCGIPVLTVRVPAPDGAADAPAFTNVLVALDESDPSDAALAVALEMANAAAFDARLTFCNVIATRDLLAKATTYGYDPTPILEELRRSAAGVVGSALEAAQACGVHAGTSVVEGEPVAEILAAAERAQADSIVIGSHGRRGLRRFFLGSVAEALVRESRFPVLVVRGAPVASPASR